MKIKRDATLADIIDFRNWLETKTGTYDAGNPSHCAVCQYMKDRGRKYAQFSGPSIVFIHDDTGKHDVVLPKTIAEIAYGEGNENLQLHSNGQAYEFSDALDRANKVIEKLRLQG